MYEIVMPQLSDSMDEGKLISWKVSVGQAVKSGDVIAEVESDKAVMEVQSFKDGVVKELLVKEGDEVKIGTVIAKVDTQETQSVQTPQKSEKESEKKSEVQERQKETPPKTETPQTESEAELLKESQHESILEDIFHIDTKEQEKPKVVHTQHKGEKAISPKARAKAAAYGLDIDTIAKNSQESILHSQDVEDYLQQKYFTPKALKLLQNYHLTSDLFSLDHKIDEHEVQEYIQTNEIPLPKALSPMQKAIISNVTASAQKPVFHIYESVDASLLRDHKEKSMTVWLIKIIAKVMMKHEAFRSKLLDNAISVMPNASLSIAVADEKDLYMPVVNDANKLNAEEIEEALKSFKTKLQKKNFTSADMQGSTFGLSNLGMLGVERFDAMINKDDAAIIAVGGINDGEISLTLTADHRLINGYEAALFMGDVKKELQNALNFKE